MKVLVISGKQGSGKTTLAGKVAEFCTDHGLMVERFKFADPIYEIQDAIHAIMKKYGFDFQKPHGPLMQKIGTEIGRMLFGEDVWVNILKNRVLAEWRMGCNELVIVDDCRFENELELFQKLRDEKGVPILTVRLEADEKARFARAEKWRENTAHPSEVGLDEAVAAGKFDTVLNSDEGDADQIAGQVLADLELDFTEEDQGPSDAEIYAKENPR